MFSKMEEVSSPASEAGEIAASPWVLPPAQLKQRDVWVSAAAAGFRHFCFYLASCLQGLCLLGKAEAALKFLLF